MHIKTVIKRNGEEEQFSPEKTEHWAQWASENLPDIDWNAVVQAAWKKCSDKCSTQDLQQAMIDACVVENASTSHQLRAGRLFIGNLWHEMFGKHWNIPTVKEWHQDLVKEGLVEDLTHYYTEAQWEEIESIIDHKRDLRLKYSQCVQIVGKYALKDVEPKRVFETPQILYMRQALWHASRYEPKRRMELLKDFYDYLSNEIICEPTPSSLYTGTVKGVIPSCVVLRASDDLPALGAVMHAVWELSAHGSGIGMSLETRAPKDTIRRIIEHNGKGKYFAAAQALADANQQAGRAGAVTSYYTCLDPEVLEIASWKNPTTVQQKRLPNLDFAFVDNTRFAKAVVEDSDWMLISCLHAQDLWDALYEGDQTKFNDLYDKYDKNPLVRKTYVNARDVLHAALKEGVETRQFWMSADEMNRHTPFKEKIYSSNLCVAPETKILTRDGHQVISELKDQTVDVWNGNEWSTVTVRKTGENQKLLKVILYGGTTLECTPYHKFYLGGKDHPVECQDLRPGDELLEWYAPEGYFVSQNVLCVLDEGRYDDTYCFNEPLRHMGVFNGILTGQCMEIALPTKPFEKGVMELFDPHSEGEIATCNLMAINVANATASDEVYERAAYLSLLMVRNNIVFSKYPFPSMKSSALGRMSAGISPISLAHLMAKEGLTYDSLWGKKFIHRLAETHSYFLHKSALRIGKEYGNAPWIDRTKYPDGWLPIDTAHPGAKEIAHQPLKRDWETLRKEIIANGGIAFSVLETAVPSESSSIKQDATSGLYPIREGVLLKKDGKKVVQWVAPEWENLKDNYQICWTISQSDMIDLYAIWQMFTGQALSADFWMVHEKDDEGKIKVSSVQMMRDRLEMRSKGLKTQYYLHHSTGGVYVQNNDNSGCSSGGCKL